MNLKPIVKKDVWGIYTPLEKDGGCQILDFFNGLNEKYDGSIEGLMAILKRVSRSIPGPSDLPVEISHYVDKNEKIYEFVVGDLRLLWFYSIAKRKIIICSHCFIKKEQKTKKAHTQKAIKLKNRYHLAEDEGNVVYLED